VTTPQKRAQARLTGKRDHKGEAWIMVGGIVIAAVALVLLFVVVFVGI
jgi:hypothetical protein